jgi:hypothetical protein
MLTSYISNLRTTVIAWQYVRYTLFLIWKLEIALIVIRDIQQKCYNWKKLSLFCRSLKVEPSLFELTLKKTAIFLRLSQKKTTKQKYVYKDFFVAQSWRTKYDDSFFKTNNKGHWSNVTLIPIKVNCNKMHSDFVLICFTSCPDIDLTIF